MYAKTDISAGTKNKRKTFYVKAGGLLQPFFETERRAVRALSAKDFGGGEINALY